MWVTSMPARGGALLHTGTVASLYQVWKEIDASSVNYQKIKLKSLKLKRKLGNSTRLCVNYKYNYPSCLYTYSVVFAIFNSGLRNRNSRTAIHWMRAIKAYRWFLPSYKEDATFSAATVYLEIDLLEVYHIHYVN